MGCPKEPKALVRARRGPRETLGNTGECGRAGEILM